MEPAPHQSEQQIRIRIKVQRWKPWRSFWIIGGSQSGKKWILSYFRNTVLLDYPIVGNLGVDPVIGSNLYLRDTILLDYSIVGNLGVGLLIVTILFPKEHSPS
jgi:hypothetical protein